MKNYIMIAKKKIGWTVNLALCLTSVALCFLMLEIAVRMFPGIGQDELQLNNPYYYIETIGKVQFFSPYYTYKERVPLKYDQQSYYAPTDGTVCFHSNQYGARWIEPKNQPLNETKILVLGDSFTYGHGLRYEDAFIYRLQKKLQQGSSDITFLNFAKRGVDSEEILTIYKRFRDTVPHNAVLYGLHINDLVRFTVNYIISNPLAIPWLVERSKGYDFIVKKIHKFLIKKYRIRQLTDPSLFNEAHFKKKLDAVVILNKLVNADGRTLYVVLLPILVDVEKNTFHPLYEGIKKALDDKGIEYIDLTGCLSGHQDHDMWILPFDQHPNQKANEIFADSLFNEFQRKGIIAGLVKK
jgi:hypothetical protein